MKTIKYSQNGIGLIEVLITTVLIALGLLAVASLQTGLISESGDSKARTEALVLAEQKIEELRNNIIQGNFNALTNSATAVNDPNNPITGTNASFNRSWVINQGGTADRKKISVWVSWGNAADEKVNIVTEMAFTSPAKSVLYAKESSGEGGTGAVPSPRQNASEDVSAASEDVVGTDLAITDLVEATEGAAGVDASLQVELDDGNFLTLYQVAPYSHFYTATHSVYGSIAPGVIAVFLCSDPDNNGTDTCSHIQNHFGGVVHRVMGKVYSTVNPDNSPDDGYGLSGIGVAWTSSDVHACYVGQPAQENADIAYMPYECIYAGNCNASPEGTRTASNADPGCFIDSIVSDAQINARNVGPGGEYGDIGLFGLDYEGGGQEQVCFLEDTVAPDTSPLLNTSGNEVLNENYLYAVTKRLYITRRVKRDSSDSSNEFKSEGINRSYSNHNFFIIERGSGGTAKAKCNTEVTSNSKQIAPREISRLLNEGTNNAVVAETSYYGGTGTAHTLTGDVIDSATDLKLFIPEVGACYLNNNLSTGNATGYACAIASDASTVTIAGSSAEHKDVSSSVFATCTREANTTPGCHWLTGFTGNYDDGGAVTENCTTPWGDEVDNGSSVDAYSTSDCSVAISRTCNTGVLDGDPTAIYETQALCETAAASNSCTSLWIGGPSIPDAVTVDAYTSESVAYGNTCPDAIEYTCNDGTWNPTPSGDLYQSCTVEGQAKLDTPAPVWNGTTELTWPAITGATGYNIYSCTETNDSNLTQCSPIYTSDTANNTLSVSLGNRETKCFNIEATDSTGSSANSNSSITKCIHVQGGTYTTQ